MSIKMIIAAFFSGLSGAMGLGGGTALIIYLSVFLSYEQKEAQGINLIFFIFIGIVAVIGNLKNGLIEKTSLKELIIMSVPGMILGFILLPVVPSQLLKRLFGAALLIFGFKTLFEPTDKSTKTKKTP